MSDTVWIALEILLFAAGWIAIWGRVFGFPGFRLREGIIATGVSFVILAGRDHWPEDGLALYATYGALAAVPILFLLARVLLWLGAPSSAPSASAPQRPTRSALPDLLLRYRSGTGEITERRISPEKINMSLKRVKPRLVDSVNAFCHLRGEPRTFKVDRIETIADAETGELLDPQVYFRRIFEAQARRR